MKTTRILNLVSAVFFLLPFFLYAQETPKTAGVAEARIEPFVSRLRAAVRGSQIKLTWQDSPNTSVQYAIYRHTREITSENFREAALIVRIPQGVEIYIDAPPAAGEFFYAVLAYTPEGAMHEVFIPFRNKTTAGILIASALSEDNLAAVITQLKAAVEGKDIVITFQTSRADRNLVLFRSTSPILTASQLLSTREARKVKSAENRIIDYPVAGIPYYYALVDENLLIQDSAANITLEAGGNTTLDPAAIPLEAANIARQQLAPKTEEHAFPEMPKASTLDEIPGRSMSLPYFILDSKISANEALRRPISASIPEYRSLSLAAEKSVENLLSGTKPSREDYPNPVILAVDRTRGFGREDYTLKTILRGPFMEKDWKEAEKLLTYFINMHITEDIRARAYFYIGQALFLQKRYEESFMDFLLAQDKYYAAVAPWLAAIFKKTETTGDQTEG
jgi:hypothetical protein